MKTTIICDLHLNFVNHHLVEDWLRKLKSGKFDKVIINGDLLDCTRLSKFGVVPDFGDTLNDERNYAIKFFQAIRRAFDGEVIYVKGNHEFGIDRVLMDVPEIRGLEEMTIPSLLQLDKYGITYKDSLEGATHFTDNFVTDQGYLVGHFNIARNTPGGTASALMNKYGVNIIQAHTHRGSFTQRRFYDRTITIVEGFCARTLNPNYDTHTNWANGWVDLVDGEPILHHFHAYSSVQCL